MIDSDWSQFFPNMIIAFFGALFSMILAGVIANFKSEKVKNWLDGLPRVLGNLVKWLVEKWYLVLPFCSFIILITISFRIFRDWNLVAFSFAAYMVGLLSWILFVSRQTLLEKKQPVYAIKSEYLPIPIPAGFGNSSLNKRYINPPFGDVVLGGVNFYLEKDSLIFDTSEHIRSFFPLDDIGKQIDFHLTKPVNGVKSVYLLINSGNSKEIYQYRSIGRIRLIFEGAPPIDVELELGRNIREWSPGNSGDYIREASSPTLITDVWTGMNKGGAYAVIDCLKIPIYEIMKGCDLVKIIFIHRSIPEPPDTMGVHFSVFGISLEIQEVV